MPHVTSRRPLTSESHTLTSRRHYSPIRGDPDPRRHLQLTDEEDFDSESDKEIILEDSLPHVGLGSQSPSTVRARNFRTTHPDSCQSTARFPTALPDPLRNQKTKTPPKNQPPVSESNKTMIIFLLIGILFVSIALYLIFGAEQETQSTTVENVDLISEKDLRTKIAEVKGYFPELSRNVILWATVSSAIKPICKAEEPRQPAVLVIMANHSGEEVASCLAKTLSMKITEAFRDSKYTYENAKKYSSKDPEEIKHILDDRIREAFSNGEHVFFLEHLDQVPADSAMIFHGMCDNDNAPYKRAVYIMTLIHKAINSANSHTEVTEIWKSTLHDDKRSALESRIGANKIFIDSIKVNDFAKHCR